MPAPPPNSDFLKSLPVLPIAVLHSLAPVSALKAVTTASVSTTTSRLSATTGAAPSRCVLVLPAMLALQIWLRDAASARWGAEGRRVGNAGGRTCRSGGGR